MPSPASFWAVLRPMPHSASAGRLPVGGQLGLQPVVSDADRAAELGRRPDRLLHLAGDRLRIFAVHGDERLVPAHDLHDVAQVPQRGHHRLRRRLVCRSVNRQEYGIGNLADRRP